MITEEHFDILIVGAGIAGISAGYHLQKNCPKKNYAILDGRDSLGGTWDLFRYPGVRSDSDMFTLGFSFRPWKEENSIADGSSILKYLKDTAIEYGIDKKIRYNHPVKKASWSSKKSMWTLHIEGKKEITCNFLFLCSGYYDYKKGYAPEFLGAKDFAGKIIHPQQWQKDVSYVNKKVVVIGSGATAVTLVPALAKKAEHVTMLQRSPTYMFSLPKKDKQHLFLRKYFGNFVAYKITRWKNILYTIYMYYLCKRFPQKTKKQLINFIKAYLGPNFDVDTHFTPNYNPWDQRVCLVPNHDLFKSMKEGKASIVTDQIERFTQKGIVLRSGEELEADIIITATGLKLQVLGGIKMDLDGHQVDFSKEVIYKGLMLSNVPNFAFSTGYTNASWTLKCDLTSAYVCRLLNRMVHKNYQQCTPRLGSSSFTKESWNDLTSGYILRSLDEFPKQGQQKPWKMSKNYLRDLIELALFPLENKALEFLPKSASDQMICSESGL